MICLLTYLRNAGTVKMLWIVLALSAVLVAGSDRARAQGSGKGTIKGKVTDSKSGETLPSVNITIKGTYYGAVTDFDGNFTVAGISPSTYTIEVSLPARD